MDRAAPRSTRRAAKPLAALLATRPASGHGHSQRDAGFVFRRRPVLSSRPRHRACAADGRGRRRHSRYRRGIRPVPMPARAGLGRRRDWRGSRRCCRRSPRSACRSRSTPSRPTSATWALDHGATIVNDVWGLQRDPGHGDARGQTRRAGDRHAQPRRGRPERSISSPTSSPSSPARWRSPRRPASRAT